MRPKSTIKILILAFVVFAFTFILVNQPVYAVDCGPNITPVECEPGTFCRPCDPPTLPSLELFAVQALGVVWGLTGLIFFVLFLFNAYLFMFNKIEDAKKRMTQWIIGLVMVLFAQPVVSTVMKLIITDESTCYEQLRQPSFTFFFPNICTGATTTPSPTIAPTGGYLQCQMPSGYVACRATETSGEYLLSNGSVTTCTGTVENQTVTGCGAN